MRLGEEYFQKDLGELFRKLKDNQVKVFPQVSIPYTVNVNEKVSHMLTKF